MEMDIEIQDYEYRLNWKWSGQVSSERESCEENRLPNGINSRSERVAVSRLVANSLLQQFDPPQDQCLFLLKLPLLSSGRTPMSGVNDQEERIKIWVTRSKKEESIERFRFGK